MQQRNDDKPHFRELGKDEIEAILARNNVGRIGYAKGQQVEIQPVHYVYSDGWIYGRTSYGSKYEAIGTGAYKWWPVVFQVDEVEGLFSWRSVLVRGGFYVLDPEGTPPDREAAEQAVRALRTLIPETLQAGDPVPSRTVLFRISVQEATGREAVPAGSRD
jgi:nitroimidazol reductase NimA-like FMN-containing flavoprotein (pyridoxamine 5'-phosphate oxidase superfamily)